MERDSKYEKEDCLNSLNVNRTVTIFISQTHTVKEIFFFQKKQGIAFYSASSYRKYSYSINLVVFYD